MTDGGSATPRSGSTSHSAVSASPRDPTGRSTVLEVFSIGFSTELYPATLNSTRHQPRRRHSSGWRSEEHTSELSHVAISYAVFCLKKKRKNSSRNNTTISYR